MFDLDKYEHDCIAVFGIKPEVFWVSTLKHVGYLVEHFNSNHQNGWLQTRNIEFANYKSAYGASGKPIFKFKSAKDIYPLDVDKKEIRVDPVAAQETFKRFNRKPSWQRKKKN